MKKYLLIFLSVVLTLACHDEVNISFKYPALKDIDDITLAVLTYDTIPIFKKEHKPDTIHMQDGRKLISYPVVIPICKELRKIKVIRPDTSKILGPPPGIDQVAFNSLFRIDLGGKRLFNSTDSAFFYIQNDTLTVFDLPKKIQDTLCIGTAHDLKVDKKAQSFYDISIPIFSADLKTAYVELRNMCNMCGGASAYILQKVNGKWKVVLTYGLWIS